VPAYVVADADETYVTTVPDGGSQYTTLTCAPWDGPSFVHYTNFLHALAEFPVYDCASGQMVPFRDHPTLGLMRVGVIGRRHFHRDQFDDLVTLPTYTRQKYIDAAIACVKAAQDAFPNHSMHVGFFTVKDNVTTPSFDSDMLAAVATNFDGVSRPRIGVFQENWTGDKPKTTSLQGQNLLVAHSNGSPVRFEALGSWLNHSPGSWTAGDNTPDNGFNFGYNNYGAVYYELYIADVKNAPFEPVFTTWHSFFESLPQE
jgi:hypothetical protein